MKMVLMTSNSTRGSWLEKRGKLAVVEEPDIWGNYHGTGIGLGLHTCNYVNPEYGYCSCKVLQRYGEPVAKEELIAKEDPVVTVSNSTRADYWRSRYMNYPYPSPRDTQELSDLVRALTGNE